MEHRWLADEHTVTVRVEHAVMWHLRCSGLSLNCTMCIVGNKTLLAELSKDIVFSRNFIVILTSSSVLGQHKAVRLFIRVFVSM